MKKFLYFCSLFVCLSIQAQELDKRFVKAIHQIETSGRLGAIKGDFVNGIPKALGPFQIHHIFWLDSGVAGSYAQCADYDYSVKVMTAYLRRYAKKSIENKDFETLARIVNGGPNGAKKEATKKYWNKVKAKL